MAFRVDPESRNIKSGGGTAPPSPAMSRVTIPRRGNLHKWVQDAVLRAARQVRPIPPCMTAHS